MTPGASNEVDVKGIAMAAMVFGGLILFIVIFTKWGITAAVSFWFLFVIALLAWSLEQMRRARQKIRREIERSGCRVVKMNYRHLRLGPFSMWDTSRSQLVYRVVTQDGTGRERVVWARCGRRWFWQPDALELKWEEEGRHAEGWSEPQ